MKFLIDKYSYIIIIFLLISSIVGFSSTYIICNTNKKIDNHLQSLNYIGKIKFLRKTYREYKEIDSKELHIRWLMLFDDTIYKSGGNSNFDKYDCLSSVWDFWKSLDSNIILESIPKMIERLNYTSKKIYKYKEIEKGDIIIFKPIWINRKQRWHIGVIEKIKKHIIFYMDVNAKIRTRGFYTINFYNKKIYAIYKMSFAFWLGDLYKKDKL